MASLSALLVSALCAIVPLSSAAPTKDGFSISAVRNTADRHTANLLAAAKGRRHHHNTGNISTDLGQSLYWFGNFNVGGSNGLSLLIDTGSSDLLLNNGLYKPKHMTSFPGANNFSITYEGVNRQGFGYETINGTLLEDVVGADGFVVKHQALGNTTSYQYFDVPALSYANPGDGIIGFGTQKNSVFGKHGGTPWIYNLCKQKSLAECRFGLAFGTSGVGQIVLGKFAKNLTKGKLVALPQFGAIDQYVVQGDVTINNKIALTDQTFIMDVGTDNIQAPIAAAKQMFKDLKYPSYLSVGAPLAKGDPNIDVLNAYFDCRNPPTIGFSFPAKSKLKKGQKATNFNVSPAVWDVYNNGNNNCTSILGGTNGITQGKTPAWLLGQSFFAGRYVDYDVRNLRKIAIGFAELKSPTNAYA